MFFTILGFHGLSNISPYAVDVVMKDDSHFGEHLTKQELPPYEVANWVTYQRNRPRFAGYGVYNYTNGSL